MKVFGQPEEFPDALWKEICGKNGHLTAYMKNATILMGRELDVQEKAIIAGAFGNGYLNGSADTYLSMQKKTKK